MPEQPVKPFFKVVRWVRDRHLAVLFAISGVTVFVLVTGVGIRTHGPLKATMPQGTVISPAGPLVVKFDRDVSPDFSPEIVPKTAGTWEQRRTVLGVYEISFKPKSRFELSRTYHLRFTNLKRSISGAKITDIDRTFKIQQAPEIGSVNPVADAKQVPVKPKFSITLTEVNNDLRHFKPTLTPAVALRALPVSADRKTYSWEPVTPLKQGTGYTFAVDDAYVKDPAKQRLTAVAFTTVTEPQVKSARTGGMFSPGQTVDITFDQPMVTDSGKFSWSIGGAGKWVDDTTYKYTPDGIKPGQNYSYNVGKGFRSKAGGVLESDRPYGFSTNGAVTGSVSPGGGGVKVSTTISVTFNQAVDHASAESRFGLNPGAPGSFSWSGNTMTYKPSTALAYQAGYSFSVAPGVVPQWGLPSAGPISGSFTTENQVVMLNVPVYKQQRNMSCELSSLRMILAYRGISVNDTDILNVVGYAPRNRDMAANFWDDPNEMYVGNVDGSAYTQKSYGVHSGPIARAAKHYGRNATAAWGVSPQFIAAAVHAGNPVEIWGHIAPAKPDAWNSPNGVVQTTTSQHAFVVVGVVGSPQNPVGFYLNDPWTASKIYRTTGALMANMNVALPASNQAVIVY